MVEEDLLKQALKGNKRSIAKLITYVENYPEKAQEIVGYLHPYTGKSHIIGITGPPGCGKSTLIDKIIKEYRKIGKSVGVVAVDPSSPYSGGAFLGDRIRMSEHNLDEHVFIRSMATRGNLGGLSRAVYDVVKILDASGKDIILIETVGAGQSETDIANIAYTTVVVTIPNLGDFVQTMKAGMVEIADIFVINKADIPGADRTVLDLTAMLELEEKKGWHKPIVKTIATANKGIKELVEKIGEHEKYLKTTNAIYEKKKKNYEMELMNLVREKLERYVLESKNELDYFLDKILNKEIDPYSAAEKIVEKLKAKS